jgi:pyruvate/2-oxoglutarate dehydrogenase complex dihydrolipoamide dehydrogenase (E3) component
MIEKIYDIIVIGAGSGGLSVGLTMNKLGFKVLMIAKSDKEIGGECLNDGCVPSKALIHVSRIIKNAKTATAFGLSITGQPDIKKAIIMYMKDRKSSANTKMQKR